MARWRVDILRKRSDHLGMVEADTEKEAIEKAIKLFNIGQELEFKITVQKAGSPRNKAPTTSAAGAEVVRHHKEADFDPHQSASNVMG